jgi:hypothetical protein
MPQKYPLYQQQQQPYMSDPYMSNNNTTSNMFASPRQPIYNDYSNTPPQIQSQPSNNTPNNNNRADFQRFYGPVSFSIENLFFSLLRHFLTSIIDI